MYKLVSCLLFLGCLSPLFSLPVLDSREEPLQLSAPGGGVRLTADALDRAPLLHGLLAMLGAETGDSLREADPGTNILNPRGITSKFQAFSRQDPNVSLNRLWAKIGKQYKRGRTSGCFWKYCV
ncbi:urotensin-2 [Saccopteryx leptura]|uniref:urotensin-2 n=1 Tax=Saccopteryx leptura TaxID=249018 RepID=UPI00339C9BB4